MDPAWIKEIVGVIAQHGPWAMFCLFLAVNLIREGRANREAHVRNTEVLIRVVTLIEGLSKK